jgi:hypothetical protein
MRPQEDEWATAIDPQLVHCPHCGAVLGVSLEDVVIIGAVRFHETITMKCGRCCQRFTWKPSPDRLDQVPRKV